MNKKLHHGFIGLIVLAGLLASGWYLTRPRPINVELIEVAPGAVETTVANTRAGTVKACHRARLSPSVGGQIALLSVTEGDQVEAGDLLLELWNKDLTAEAALIGKEVQALDAKARAACLKADVARREADRMDKMLYRKLASEEAADRADTEAAASAASCEAAKGEAGVRRAKLAVIEAQLEKTRLSAPFAGVIAEVNGELNEYVTPSPPGIPTPPAVDLIDNSCFYVSAPIDEVDLAGVKVGQPARITLDAFDERSLAGKVRRIAPYVLDLEKQARTVDVEVEFTNPEDLKIMLAGYSADVEIILAVAENVLRIPTETLLDEDHVFVYRAADQTLERRKVEKGAANWDFTAIESGLDEGDRIVVPGEDQELEDGTLAMPDAAAKP